MKSPLPPPSPISSICATIMLVGGLFASGCADSSPSPRPAPTHGAGMSLPVHTAPISGVKDTAALSQIKQIGRQLTMYKVQNGDYPSTEQGLEALIEEPGTAPFPSNWSQILTNLPDDPWGTPYRYKFTPGKNGRSGKEFDLWTVGPDGKDRTDDDIGNWRK